MNTQDALVVQLKVLALKIKDELQANTSMLIQEVRMFTRDKILDFEYNQEGVNFSETQMEYITENFYRLSGTIAESIRNTSEYNSVLQAINACKAIVDSKSLDRFVKVIAEYILNKSDLAEEIIDTTIISFLKDIYQEPFKLSAVVELVGVVIDLESLELDSEIFKVVIRQIKIEDLEKKKSIYSYPAIDFYSARRWLIPSAIIDIEFYGYKPYEIQYEIQKIVTVLRLFRASSTDYNSYRMDSEAILLGRKADGTIVNHKQINILEKLKITEENAGDLVSFYRGIKNIIPKVIYNQPDFQEKTMIHLAIAYHHYSEALLSNVRIEEKFTNAVIGLESILLAENQEISFRFWVRGAKILGLLNYSPLQVKKILKAAYDIRSTFVHGDELELDKKLRKINDNKPEKFLIELLDYLRVLIVLMIFLSKNKDFLKNSKSFDKKKFLELVDDSLISVEKEAQLKDLLSCITSECTSCLNLDQNKQ